MSGSSLSVPTPDLDYALADLTDRLEPLDIMPSLEQLRQLRTFCTILAQYNEHTNLVSKSDPKTLVMEHLLDAWSMVPAIRQRMDQPGGRLVDIGAGAGFPGMVLAVAMPDLNVVLVESIAKKTKFLTQAAEDLGLSQRVQIINARAESLGHQKEYRAGFDFATARAVGSMGLICELALPLLKVSGYLIAPKSRKQAAEESRSAEKAAPALGGKLEEVLDIDRSVTEKEHVLLLIKKTKNTPDRYPRKAAQIKREPLGAP